MHNLDSLYRRNNAIHYYLKKDDVLTALSEIRNGTSPFVKDECNRTPLDFAIVLFMRKYQECIFTSFIIDLMYSKSKIKAKHTYDRNNIINHNNYRYGFNSDMKNYNEKMYYYYDNVMDHLKNIRKFNEKHKGNEIKNNKRTTGSVLLKQKMNYFPFALKEYDNNDDTNIEKLKKENDLLFLFDEVLTLPMSKSVEAQLKDILKKMNALLFFIKVLSKDIILKKHSENILKEEISKLFIPFLYNYSIHSLFKLFPKNHLNEQWDMNNPADARRLINIILSKQLLGYQLMKFIGKSLFYFSFLVGIYGEKVFVQEPLICQYFLHMSFTLDNEYLFNVIINKSDIFQIEDIFDWNKLIKSITPYKKKFKNYYKPLVYSRLRKIFLERLKIKREKEAKQNESMRSVSGDNINKSRKKKKSRSKKESISKNAHTSSNVNASKNMKASFDENGDNVDPNINVNMSIPYSDISNSYFGNSRKDMKGDAKKNISRKVTPQDSKHGSRHGRRHGRRHGSNTGSIQESRYESKTESRHGSRHGSNTGRRHSSKTGSIQESRHGNRIGSIQESRHGNRIESIQESRHGNRIGSIQESRYESKTESIQGIRPGHRNETPKRCIYESVREEGICNSERSYGIRLIPSDNNSSNFRGTTQSVQKIPETTARKGIQGNSVENYLRISGRANDRESNVQESELRNSIQESRQKSLENSGADNRKVYFNYKTGKNSYCDYSKKSQRSIQTKNSSHSIKKEEPKTAVLDLYKNIFTSYNYNNK